MNEPQKNQPERIGIMGGTFDPIHFGHLLIAQSAAEEFGLDRVIFLPTGKSPHKSSGQVSSANLRCCMVREAIEGQEIFELSEMEAENTEINYTFRTLQTLTERYPGIHFYFIMGEDSLDDFSHWRNPQIICDLATILVAVRTDNEAVGIGIGEKLAAVREQYHADIYMLHAPNFSISSREIRQRVRQGKSVHYMLPEKVEAFIREHMLYSQRVDGYDGRNSNY